MTTQHCVFEHIGFDAELSETVRDRDPGPKDHQFGNGLRRVEWSCDWWRHAIMDVLVVTLLFYCFMYTIVISSAFWQITQLIMNEWRSRSSWPQYRPTLRAQSQKRLEINGSVPIYAIENGIWRLERSLILEPIESAYCDFLLDLSSHILPRFKDIIAFVRQKPLLRYPSPIPAKISGCSPWNRSVMLRSTESEHTKLTNR